MANPIGFWRGGILSPMKEWQKMQSQMDRLFEDMTSGLPRTGEEGSVFNPSFEVHEDKANYYLKFDLPGIPKDQIKIEMRDNVMTLSAERTEEHKKEDKKQTLSEICYGSYERAFAFPSDVNDKAIDAKLENGVLTVTVPKAEPSTSKQIAIH